MMLFVYLVLHNSSQTMIKVTAYTIYKCYTGAARKEIAMEKVEKDITIVLKFIATYCHHNHHGQQAVKIQHMDMDLCNECTDLAQYAVKRRINCPKNPKPACKDCDIHCYMPKYRQEIKKAMKFSGIHFIKRGRLDYLYHYFKS